MRNNITNNKINNRPSTYKQILIEKYIVPFDEKNMNDAMPETIRTFWADKEFFFHSYNQLPAVIYESDTYDFILKLYFVHGFYKYYTCENPKTGRRMTPPVFFKSQIKYFSRSENVRYGLHYAQKVNQK